MQCASPIKIRKSHYNVLSKQIEDVLEVPCGKCINCRIAKSREWSLRCLLELPYFDYRASFITLTYDNERVPEGYIPFTLDKSHAQKFIKRLRKDMKNYPDMCDNLGNPKLKYFLSGEYGERTQRSHFHIILFGVGLSDEYNLELGCFYTENHLVEDNWKFGNVFTGTVTYNSCRYVAEYVFKKYSGEKKKETYDLLGRTVPFQLVSHGLGERFIVDFYDVLLERGYIIVQGKKFALPRYFSDKLKLIDNSRLYLRRTEFATKNFDEWCSNHLSNYSIVDELEALEKMEVYNKNNALQNVIHNEKLQIIKGR